MTYAKRVLELQEGVQHASDAMKKCHSANVQLTADKKVCIGGTVWGDVWRSCVADLGHGLPHPQATFIAFA